MTSAKNWSFCAPRKKEAIEMHKEYNENTIRKCERHLLLNTGWKLNVHEMYWTSFVRLMYVPFTFLFQGDLSPFRLTCHVNHRQGILILRKSYSPNFKSNNTSQKLKIPLLIQIYFVSNSQRRVFISTTKHI